MAGTLQRISNLAQRSYGRPLPTRSCYTSTQPNLKLSSQTKVLCQGFTGKQEALQSRQALDYGTKMVLCVGCVYPGQGIRYFRTSCVLGDEVRVVNTPPFADSISEGDVRWEKAVGDAVAVDETVCEIETDKTSIPVPSPGNGIIEELLAEDGSTVKAGQQLFKIRITGDAPAKSSPPPKTETPPPSPKVEAAAPPPPAPKPQEAQVSASPPPSAPPPPPVKPSKPKETIPATPRSPPPIQSATVKVPPTDPAKEITGTRTEQRVKMNRMRLRIAQRLKDAQNTNAMLTTFNEIDMSNIMEMRKQHGEAFAKRHGIKLGFMSPFVRASAYALQDQPVVNAVIDGPDILYRDYVDISVAVATPKGLVVPVLRNVEGMSYADIEKGMAALGAKARDGNLAVEDMDGGSFTISNGGVFGSLYGTPIINPPQSAILGMHAIFDRPVARNGQVVIRPMMYVALTYDHRLIDGREAVTFLKKIKSSVEDPRNMLLELTFDDRETGYKSDGIEWHVDRLVHVAKVRIPVFTGGFVPRPAPLVKPRGTLATWTSLSTCHSMPALL